jgi:hypothetical protein
MKLDVEMTRAKISISFPAFSVFFFVEIMQNPFQFDESRDGSRKKFERSYGLSQCKLHDFTDDLTAIIE